mgnify:FL=1
MAHRAVMVRAINQEIAMLNGAFNDNVDSKSRGDTGLWHLVVELNKVISNWD